MSKTKYGGLVVVLAVGCLVPGAWCQPVSMTLDNAGYGNVMGGVYTSPYGISINNGAATSLICDDFTTDISIGQMWTGVETTLTTINSADIANLKFGKVANAVQDYGVAAVLSAELLGLPNQTGTNAITAGELSYAIWDVFDPTLLTSVNTGYGTLTSGELSAALSDLSAAQTLVAAATSGGNVNLGAIDVGGQAIESLTIYTPNPLAASQEFLTVRMPEPSYPATLAVDLTAVVGLILFFRRRPAGVVN
jgi:hypothetical protein